MNFKTVVNNSEGYDQLELVNISKEQETTQEMIESLKHKKVIKILLGGSPCTNWSIAKGSGRETEPSGIGWELFKNYAIAKEKFAPDIFLYENNKSASQAIKDEICEVLGHKYTLINSALVSAQNRQRFYVTPLGENIPQPENKGILLKDIILDIKEIEEKFLYKNRKYIKTTDNKESGQVASLYLKGHQLMKRIYGINGKSQTLNSCAGGNLQTKILQNNIARKLTPLEYERLQTLPDNYTAAVSNSQRYKGIGNGWTADVIIHILNQFLADVPRDTKLQVLSMYDGIATGRYCLDKMGFKNVEYHAYEIDKYAMQVAMSNYPDIIQHGDAFKVLEESWCM